MTFRALLVDDDDAFAKLVAIRLRAWKKEIEIVFATSLKEAREILGQPHTPFSLVVLDQNLPDGFGYELVEHSALRDATVLAVSADETPTLPGDTLRAGAQHFLGKRQVSAPLFIPLIEAMLERKDLEQKLHKIEMREAKMGIVQTLVSTLRHEINNPLGAVIGAAYVLKMKGNLDEHQLQALALIEQSGERIKNVLKQLCDAVELEEVEKATELVFHVPGDKAWEPTKN